MARVCGGRVTDSVNFDPVQFMDAERRADHVRTMTYVFLFDAAFTIFHNSPPRMVVSELKMDMTCPEACFQAQSAEECFIAPKQWASTPFWRHHLSIAAVVKNICPRELPPESVTEYAKLGSLNLFKCSVSVNSISTRAYLDKSRSALPHIPPPELHNFRINPPSGQNRFK